MSRQLLVRAGYVRQGPGGEAWLLLGQRSLARMAQMLRAEMEAMGAQEMRLSTGAVRAIARADLRSYKQLPQIWYEIDIRQNSWSLHWDAAGLEAARQSHAAAYRRILKRCGVECPTAELMLPSETGEEYLVTCGACGYAANLDRAVARPKDPAEADPHGDLKPEAFHTPGRKTIADVSEFTGLSASSQMKSLVLMADGEPVLVLVRGDHQLSDAKFADETGDRAFRPANAAEIRAVFGADPGSLGPVGVTRLKILADHALRGRRNMIAGANRDDYHLRHVTPGEDFQAEFLDLRQVEPGDLCVHCGAPLEVRKAMEIAFLRRLHDAALHVTNAEGVEVPLLIGFHGMRLDRVLAAAVELHHDKDGMILPPAIAPFTLIVTPVNIGDAVQRPAAMEIYQASLRAGIDVLLDDRDERPGVKFKDADLIGAPFRITVGRKAAAGMVELVERDGHQVTDVSAAEAAVTVATRLKESYAG
ncbi:MAG TPA: YbaK/EbsC family protein [Bryobacteraceae bacterium]|nr:YbaK/EbsC family protein [Bryobacteraceae bacterium]